MDDLKQKRFLWGAALACVPLFPMVIGLAPLAHGMSNSKATGLAAFAGVLAEGFVTCGVAAVAVCQAVAIVLLFRSFSSGRWARNLFSAVSIGLSGLMLLFVGLFLWAVWFLSHHTF